jgi:hypothetical protein
MICGNHLMVTRWFDGRKECARYFHLTPKFVAQLDTRSVIYDFGAAGLRIA